MDYYNEFEPYAVQWLRNLANADQIPPGAVDPKSILDVQANELAEYRRCHFFAGIAGWALALKLAGWPETVPVWTGSCPCQPFSAAGKQKGEADERHLWPTFRGLIEKRRPPVVFGEQVASPLGRQWLAGVRSDLEGMGYRVGCADLCAAGVGAPHIRQRLYWVADTQDADWGPGIGGAEAGTWEERIRRWRSSGGSATSRMVDAVVQRLEGHSWNGHNGDESGRVDSVETGSTAAASFVGRMGDSESGGCGVRWDETFTRRSRHSLGAGWSRYDFLYCRDGKTRRIEPGTFPLAHGIPARVGKLRAYGNAIVPQVAATFVMAYLYNMMK